MGTHIRELLIQFSEYQIRTIKYNSHDFFLCYILPNMFQAQCSYLSVPYYQVIGFATIYGT